MAAVSSHKQQRLPFDQISFSATWLWPKICKLFRRQMRSNTQLAVSISLAFTAKAGRCAPFKHSPSLAPAAPWFCLVRLSVTDVGMFLLERSPCLSPVGQACQFLPVPLPPCTGPGGIQAGMGSHPLCPPACFVELNVHN